MYKTCQYKESREGAAGVGGGGWICPGEGVRFLLQPALTGTRVPMESRTWEKRLPQAGQAEGRTCFP